VPAYQGTVFYVQMASARESPHAAMTQGSAGRYPMSSSPADMSQISG
jgi:hypothetical protein